MRIKIVLACDECQKRNYTVKKNKLTHPERMEVKKYCSKCCKHTIHKETK